MGVLTTKEGPNYLHSYPINTSQVIPFLRSFITFSGKRLLTPEGVTGEFSLTRGLFSRSVSYVHCRHKSLCPRSLFCVNCLLLVQTIIQDVPCHYLSSPKFQLPAFIGGRETTSGSYGSVCFLGHKPEVGVLGVRGSKLKRPSTRPTTY